ncbi:MAG: 30S ribosomal protein S12 methylthiotransferase RimO [candidate division Zixibacteria bacterium]|nr:30S ribosomal protein S12 methylthiotransferase RimO [candidate division Zixibacteria bacterium]
MTFYIYRLGCPKNEVDGDYIAARLLKAGHIQVDVAEGAEAVIINTCGFILPAKEESIEAILQMARLKTEGGARRLFATGCLSQRYGHDLLADIPELDGVFGLGELDALADAMSGLGSSRSHASVAADELSYLDWKQRFISDAYPYAYLKIADGCNRRCTFCAIPSIRGRYRSRPMDSILNEARFLIDNGKRELILVSQEATVWGNNLSGRPKLVNLLSELESLSGLEWIRVMYLHPSGLNVELIEHMTSGNKTLAYFDLPLQHINAGILAAMGRQNDSEAIADLISRIRHASPDSALRTTFIVGFPGETEEHFQELCQFVEATAFDRLGAFCYSAEEGTPGADLPDQVPEEVKTERLDRLMLLQQEIAFAKNNSLIDSTQEVIIDAVSDDGSAVGRTQRDCPDIDQEVTVVGDGLTVGSICQVRITEADGYDLRAVRSEE